MGACVYMLSCADGSYYVGTATGSDLNRRVSEHQSGVRPGYYSIASSRPTCVVGIFRPLHRCDRCGT
ncbi:MAG: GIY-YIG nuclease family protein [Pseudolabrys sp.]